MKYGPEIVEKICKLIASDDYTITEICKKVGITHETFITWKKTKSEFSESIKKAEEKRLEAFKGAARSGLMTLLKGKSFTETTTEYVAGTNGEPVIKSKREVKKFILPNPTSVIFALKNVDPETFKDVQEVKNTNFNYNSAEMTPEEIRRIDEALENEV